MTTYLHEDPRVAATVERQLQQSALRREMGERAATPWRAGPAGRLSDPPGDDLAGSRGRRWRSRRIFGPAPRLAGL